jgi:hypothetical protein
MVKLLDLLDATPGLGAPSGIIFLLPPKLRIEGIDETQRYGWAPSTWPPKHPHPYHQHFHPSRQTVPIMKQGLFVEFIGLVLHCPNIRVEQCKFLGHSPPMHARMVQGRSRHPRPKLEDILGNQSMSIQWAIGNHEHPKSSR